MYQFNLLTNSNAKRTNQTSSSSRATEIYPEPEFSYNDVLHEELSRSSRQHKRNTSNNFQFNNNINSNNDEKISLQDIKSVSLDSRNYVKKFEITGPDVFVRKTDTEILQEYVKKLMEEKENPVLKGDANGDGVVDLKDLETMVNRMFDDTVGVKMKNVDFDSDGKISLQDIEKVIDIIVNQNNEPNPPEEEILKGDANGDGRVNYRDVQYAKNYALGYESNINFKAADINNNGTINMMDVQGIVDLAEEREAKIQKLKGDSNNDGVVDERDYTNVKNYIENINSSEDFIRKNSDINGDGEIDEEDLKRLRDIVDGFRVNYSSTTNLGDIDGDGSISIKDAVFLKNYINRIGNSSKDFFINNADVNKDGKLDISDITAITDLLKNVRTVARELPVWSNVELTNKNGDMIRPGDNVIFLERENDSYKIQYTAANGEEKIGWVHRFVFDPIPPPDPTPYPYDTHIGGRAVWTYTDENLSNHQGNDVVTSGQNIIILGETDKAFRIRYTNSKNEVIERYLPKSYPPEYQTWTGLALSEIPAYTNEGLSSRIGSERVDPGDKVTVLKETDTAYQVEYPTKYGSKIRWITKTDVVPYEKQDNPNPSLQDMHISDEGIALVKRWEADNIYKYLTAYPNPGEEYLTIGYGHYGPDVKPGMTITVAQAEAYLRQDLLNAEKAVKKYCAHLNLNQHQFDALVSFTFNLDVKNLLRLLHGENGDEVRPLEELPEHMVWYRKDGTGSVSQGLINRREAEVKLFNTPV